MATHDYVKFVRRASRPPLDPAALPTWKVLIDLSGEIHFVRQRLLDLGGLKDLDDPGTSLNPEELARTRLLLDLLAEFPELTQVAGVDPTLLKDANDLDLRVLGLKAASADLVTQTQLGERLLAVRLTELNDQVEDAVTQFIHDPTVAEVERGAVRYRFAFPGFAHAWVEDRQKARQDRRALRQRRLQDELSAIEAATKEQERLAALKAKEGLALASPKAKGKRS